MKSRESGRIVLGVLCLWSVGNNAVDVEVETCEVVTHQDQRAIPERADVDFRRGTRVETANVAEAYGGFVPLPGNTTA